MGIRRVSRKRALPSDPATDLLPRPRPIKDPPPKHRPIERDPDQWAPDFSIPTVAAYAAKMLISCVMDYSHAALRLLPGDVPAEKTHVDYLCAKLRASKEVSGELEKLLAASGLDEQSKSAFVDEMWSWLRGNDARLKRQAAMILGRGFIAEKVLVDKPEELPIQGFGDGIKAMLAPSPGSMTPLPPRDERREISRPEDSVMTKLENITHSVIRRHTPSPSELTSHPSIRENEQQEITDADESIN